MTPLDLTLRPPRSCYAELDGLMLLPRTIDKARALMPGGVANGYFIDGPIQGISGFFLQRLGVSEAAFYGAVREAATEDEVATWLRSCVDVSIYPSLNATLQRITPQHAQSPELVRAEYADTLALYPELHTIFDILDADDRRRYSHGA